MLRRFCTLFRPSAKRLGLEYQQGIMRRYVREQAGWDVHIAHTQAAILRFLEQFDQNQPIQIAGSGWMLDIPMEKILSSGSRVCCYDLTHPIQITHRYRGNPQVTFYTLDLTGGLMDLLTGESMNPKKLLQACQELGPPLEVLNADWPIISLNLLSQLPYPIFEVFRNMDKEEISACEEILQQKHIKWLKGFKDSLLVSDVEEMHTPLSSSCSNKQESRPTIQSELPNSDRLILEKESWIWPFDYAGAYRPGYRVDLRVEARVYAH